jgi:catechol 2,3-dioxygenase-like lactoylglutathione lyase family enzyme
MRFDGLMVITRRIDECEGFYEHVLGQPASEHGKGWVQFHLPGDQLLSLHTPWSDELQSEGSSSVLLLSVESVAEESLRMAAQGIAVSEPHEIPGGQVVTVVDPDGRLVQLVERAA